MIGVFNASDYADKSNYMDIPDPFSRAIKAFKATQEMRDAPLDRKAKEMELQTRQLANAFSQNKLNNYDQDRAMDVDLMKARIAAAQGQANQYNQPEVSPLVKALRAAQELQGIKSQFGENSQEYKAASQVNEKMYGGNEQAARPVGTAATIAWLTTEKQNNPNNPAIPLVEKQLELEQDRLGSLNDSRSIRNSPYGISTPDYKNQMVAQGLGAGLTMGELQQGFLQGKDLYQIGREHNITPQEIDDAEPLYPVGKTDISRVKNRRGFSAEQTFLDNAVTDLTKEFSGRQYHGYSPKQIWNSITSNDTDKQARYLAGTALSPESVSVRIRSLGGNVGIEAMREVAEKALQDNKIPGMTISDEAYAKAHHIMVDTIAQAVEKYNEEVIRFKKKGASTDKNASNLQDKMYTGSNGKQYSQSQVEMAAKKLGISVDDALKKMGAK